MIPACKELYIVSILNVYPLTYIHHNTNISYMYERSYNFHVEKNNPKKHIYYTYKTQILLL